jgi:hypothetical protein
VKLGKRMTFEKKEIREKNLKEPPGWILGIIKRELNLFDLCHNEMVATCMISTIRPWRTGDRTINNILLIGFGTNIILICYVRLSSQSMISGLGVWQGRSR